MDALLFLKTCTALLVVAALGGAVMAGMRFTGTPHPPAWLAMLHGLVAGAALTLLIFGAATVGLPALAMVAVVLFVLAAAGGAYLNLNFHMRGVELPKWLVLGHGGIAVAGFVCLVMALIGALHS
jgi:hypothetical protein